MVLNLRRSDLQKKIMFYLSEYKPARTITELTRGIGKLRPSVSRSLKALKTRGLVRKGKEGWKLTEDGKAETSSFFIPATGITWVYGDLYICFYCLCGEEVTMAQEEGERLKKCECGRVYRFTCKVEVKTRQ